MGDIAAGKKINFTAVLSDLSAQMMEQQAEASAAQPSRPRGGRSLPASTEQLPSGLFRPLTTAMTAGSEFSYVDAEGAPDRNGTKHHGAKDWFAPANSPVFSPINGQVVYTQPSRGRSGQIFGGVVKIMDSKGRVFVFRHIDPRQFKVGQKIGAGARIGKVTAWTGGSPHAHIEIWRTLAGGYAYENMIDPASVFV